MEMKWKIGSVEMENPFILAPMAGVTDLPFRMLCKEQGAGLLCTEMVSAKAISFHNKNTISLMQINPSEHPVSMQIFERVLKNSLLTYWISTWAARCRK